MFTASRTAPRSPTLVPVPLLLFAAALASGFVLWVALDSHTYSDFAVFYDSALAMREGRDVYVSPVTKSGWHNMNPPHFIALTAPLAWLSIRSALIAWWLLTAVAMIACVRLWRRALPAGWSLALFALLAASAAGYLNVRAGNQTWVFAAIVTWAWIAWRENHYSRAAAVLGWAASIKLFLLIVLPYLVWRRHWKAVGSFVAATAIAVLTGISILGPHAYVEWVHSLSDQSWQGQALSMSLLGGITRAFDGFSGTPMLSASWLIIPLWLVLNVGVLAVMCVRLRREDADRDFAAVLTAMLIMTPSGWMYYIPLFAGPVATTLARSRASWLWIASVVALLTPYPFVAVASGSSLILMTIGSIYLWGGIGLLIAVLQTDQLAPAVITDTGYRAQ